MIWVLILMIALISGGICAAIAQSKNLGVGGYFFLGFFLGVIGIIIAIVVKPDHPAAPPGMVATTCTRCNAVQNVPSKDKDYECWQCKQRNDITPRVGAVAPAALRFVSCSCGAAYKVAPPYEQFECSQCNTLLKA